MLSKIAGKTLGVVKNPLVVIVRMPPNSPYGPVPFLKQLDWIIQDWEQKKEAEEQNPKGRAPVAIINMSIRFWWTQRPGLSREGKTALSKIANRFNEAITAGLLPVTASGNMDNNGGVRCLHILCISIIATYSLLCAPSQ